VIRVTINCCLSFLRREKVRSHASLDAHDAGTVAGGKTASREPGGGGIRGREHSAGRGVEQEQNRAALVRALNSLDEESRALLVLRDLQDLDYQQLAEVFELPLGTVKSRLFRAREALRTALEGMGF
jgi:RNA polymerase sigma-70 factor (ECF subfamily)